MSTKTYLFHERSSIFPLIEGEDFEAFIEDIKEHGLLETIVLYEGTILDGSMKRGNLTIAIEEAIKDWINKRSDKKDE